MTRRNPPARWVLPSVVDPPRICFQIEVPNDRQHIAAFRGAILNLASAIHWQNDVAHTAKKVAAVWDDVYTKIRTCPDCNTSDQGISLEDFVSQQIRISPDDPCIIQMWCIDHWEDWYNPLSCVPGAIEQPTNGEPLEAGGCREWDVSLRANEKWLLPLLVDAGDTISITEATGAWNDGGLGWNCVSGHTYALGACVSADPAGGGDPFPTGQHMQLIMSVDGTFVDAYNTLYAVPSGVSDAQVFFQANDDPISDNSGSVSFHVKVCNHDQPEWSHTFDFQNVGPGGWVVASGGSPIATYVPGEGFHVDNPSAAPGQGGLLIRRDFGTTQISHVEVYAESDTASSAGGRAVALTLGATTVAQVSMPDATGEQYYDVAAAGVCNIAYVAFTCAAAGTHSNIRKVIVHGFGIDPF